MNSIDNLQRPKPNNFLWVIIAVLITAGVVANSYFSSVAWPLRLSGWIVLVIIMVLLAFRTAAGKKFWSFAKEARIELRKVVWPTKDETTRTTMIIAALVIFVSLILWCVDTLLLMAVNWFTG
jgi:preprotein translocase subunit SecE